MLNILLQLWWVKNLVKVASGVVATVAAVVPFADADFDNDYIVLVVAVQITVFIVGLAVAFFVGFYIVLLKDADVPTVFYADTQYSSYNL